MQPVKSRLPASGAVPRSDQTHMGHNACSWYGTGLKMRLGSWSLHPTLPAAAPPSLGPALSAAQFGWSSSCNAHSTCSSWSGYCTTCGTACSTGPRLVGAVTVHGSVLDLPDWVLCEAWFSWGGHHVQLSCPWPHWAAYRTHSGHSRICVACSMDPRSG